VLQDNGSDTLNVSANGTFMFATRIAQGGAYAVTVLQQPTGQTCAVSSGSGTVAADVTSVAVACGTKQTFSVGGTVSNLAAGATLVLQDNGGDNLNVSANGTFAFATKLAAGATYSVAVLSQPTAQNCSVTNASGMVSSAAVTNVEVMCAASSNVIFFDDFVGASLSTAWTVISRHGEYAQQETECNTPQQLNVADGLLTITTAAGPLTCGDFQIDGTVRHAPSSWPYVTGDLQWRSLKFTYGTVTVRAKFPAQGTVLWPAIWLLGSNCQNTNPFTADVGYDTCPEIGSADYAEIDMVECDLNNWCQLALANLANTGSGGTSFPTCGYPVDTNFHTFTLTWTPNAVAVVMDGQPTGCSYTSPAWTIPSTPMFLIIQTQTGGSGGAPNDALLPASLQIDFVQVTQP
jgi:beta-glucanase (GH16 family)